jgi:Dyp-type peroxidase family
MSRMAEAADVQGLVRGGYPGLAEAVFVLLRVTDARAARRWLASVRVTTAADLDSHVTTAVQIAVSAQGLRALGVSSDLIAGFSAEFLSGIAGDTQRSRRLGDVGANAPEHWIWGGAATPDVLLALYAEAGKLAALRDSVVTDDALACFAIVAELPTSDMGGREPFGFIDGTSQPRFDFAGKRRPGTDADLGYGNLLAAGEVLLGYENEYRRFTERPLVDPTMPGAGALPPAADTPARRDLGRNGSYLVLRQLAQDVAGFWRFAAAHGDATQLAEAMVGRRLSADPLVPTQAAPLRGVGPNADDLRLNNFTYEDDPDGQACPFAAHVRRANPRTGDMPGGHQGLLARGLRMIGFAGGDDLRDDAVASSRFHRILRRGREYGVVADGDAGLNFICLNANIARQFEFIQNAWIMNAKFNGLDGEADPLLGNREPFPEGCATDRFGALSGLPRFVTVRGGGYFFLPGERALRFIAGA